MNSGRDAEPWTQRYRDMIVSADEAVARIRPGQRVFIGTGCGQPQALVDALLKRAGDLDDVEVVLLLALGDPAFRHHELAEHFRLKPFFIDESADGRVGLTPPKPSGQGTGGVNPTLQRYTPLLFSDIPEVFRSGRLPIDVALIQVTEPDERGLCSLGVSVDVTKDATENAGLVIAQVNPQMPWTAGDGLVRIHDLDWLVPCDEPLLEIAAPEPDDTSRRVAEHVAALIPDGATLQFGVHRIPQALVELLKGKRDLGIHAEEVGDAIIDLLESGAVTGLRKASDRGKVVCSLCLGTRELHRYLDRNPTFRLRSAEHVSDPAAISRQRNMVALCLACEIDLRGQVCVDSPEAGFSGIGGHTDFAHGAVRARGGSMIVALESTRRDGAVSRIVSRLSGAGTVATTCFEVHYVVTEYGVAYLHGKSFQERAMALISIAHPDARAKLLREAIESGCVNADLAAIEGKIRVGPPELKLSMLLDDGTLVSFRPMRPTDEPRMRELFHSLSKQTMYYRFMSELVRLPQRQIQDFVYIDYRDEMAIVGTIPQPYGEEIIAVGRYYLDGGTNRAEVAFIVRDQWQNRGIGTFLLKSLSTIAKGQGIAGFTAEVLVDNRAMLAVLRHSGFKVSSRLEGRVHSVELDLQATPD